MRARGEITAKFEAYLAGLQPDRASMMRAIRRTILKHLPDGYAESFDGTMIKYEIPLSRYPKTYNRQPLLLAGLASQRSFVTLYLMAVYGDKDLESWFYDAYAKSGRRLDMGRSCVHFRKVEDIPLGVIGRAISKVPVERYIRIYEAARQRATRR